MGMRRREGTGRAGLVHASRKSGQRGQTRLSSCPWVVTVLLPPGAGRSSAHSCGSENEHLRSLERQKGPRSQAPAGKTSARQGETGLPEVLQVMPFPHVFGADTS